jgi:hypothetical protein
MSNNIHVGDIGTIFKLKIVDDDTGLPIDVSLADTKEVKFRPPDGPSVTKTASFTTDGSDGWIQYTTIAADLSIDGDWDIQGFVVRTGFYSNHSEVKEFVVHDNL